jgi:hypothetical protein
MAKARVTYVAQYLPAGANPDSGWKDLSPWDIPDAAFTSLDRFQASWNALADQGDRPQGHRVVKRTITDEVVADPRPAPETP